MAPSAEKEYTLEQVAEHTKTESCWLIIGNEKNGGPMVYDVTKYLDDHPGGAEVMLDVAGQDADEFFEDIGHSKEAREELKKYLIGSLKIDEATKKKMEEEKAKKAAAKGGGFPVLPLVGIVLAVAAYFYVSQSKAAESE